MKVYIQLFVVVLCFFFIQDALAAQPLKNIENVQPQYENLDELQGMFWDAMEQTNMDCINGKKVMRSVRNLIAHTLTNQVFWELLLDSTKKQAKLTNNKTKADTRLKFCNALTQALTIPVNTDTVLYEAENVYEMIVPQLNGKMLHNALEKANTVINSGQIDNFLDTTKDVVLKVNVNPNLPNKLFKAINSSFNTGGMMNMNGALSNNLAKFTGTLNRTKSLFNTL